MIVLRNYFSSPQAKEPGDEATSVHPLQLANWWLVVLVARYIASSRQRYAFSDPVGTWNSN